MTDYINMSLATLGITGAAHNPPLTAEVEAAITFYELQQGRGITDAEWEAIERELDAIEQARDERDCPYAREERLALRYYSDWLTLEQIKGGGS